MPFQYEDHRIYMKDENGKLIAEITFPFVSDRKVNIDHTFVDDSLRGQGVAGQLVQAAIGQIRKAGWDMTATCSYTQAWLERHPEACG